MATILIIDDQPTIRAYLTTLLRYEGHRLLQAADGSEGFAVAKAELPHLVIADILMPTMDGYEFVRQLRADPAVASVPVIFFTAYYHEREAQALAHACEYFHILTKPCKAEEVLRTVDAALAVASSPVPPLAEEFDRDHLRVLTDKLSEEANHFRRVNARLTALIDERKQAAARLQALSHRLLEVQEEERRHLARELHDEFGQVLAAITLHLHAARGLAGEAALPRLDECATLLQQAGERVRGLALELRPTMLDTLGLEAALRWLAEQHQQRAGCAVQVAGHLSGAPPSPETAIACFRVAQEALTNVARHAASRRVWIELSQGEGVLELVVGDDGVGFDVAHAQEQAARGGRLGLLGMAERVLLLGGALEVESEPGRGTRVHASFPLSKVPAQPAGPPE